MEREPKPLLLEKEMEKRVRWFIRLRWLAVLGIFSLSWIPAKVFGISLPLLQISVIGLMVLVLNIFYFFLKGPVLTKEWFGHLQVGGDWLCLIAIVHYTGGIESPVLFYFIFHILISAVLLPRRACFIEATVALLMIAFLAVLEALWIIPHMPVEEFFPWYLYRYKWFVIGQLFFLATTFYAAAYLATTVTQALKKREGELLIAHEKLKEMDKAKDEYVLKVTHELRAPLSAIESLLRTLEEGYAGQIPEALANTLTRIKHRAAFLLQLVNDLLDLASGKLERPKKEEYREVDMRAAIKSVLSLMHSKIEAKRLKLSVDSEPMTLRAVPTEIDLILTNLIDNAIKYTPEGGSVAVINKQEGKLMTLEVIDTGVGIPEEAKPYIFLEFYRAENAKAWKREGTGLGLAIVRNLVKHYSGEISFHSELNKGTTFTVRLPLRVDSKEVTHSHVLKT